MLDKDIIRLFKKNNEMSDRDWFLFCNRYADKSVGTVMRFFKEMCEKEGIQLPKSFLGILQNEMKERKRMGYSLGIKDNGSSPKEK